MKAFRLYRGEWIPATPQWVAGKSRRYIGYVVCGVTFWHPTSTRLPEHFRARAHEIVRMLSEEEA